MYLVIAIKNEFFTSFNALWSSHHITLGSSPIACDYINKAHNQVTFLATFMKAQYSTSIVDNAIVGGKSSCSTTLSSHGT
jgi:hypothetical protein